MGAAVTVTRTERARDIAEKALALLQRSGVPPYPIYFELFYIYVTGTNTELNRALNATLSSGGTMDEAQAAALCKDFLNLSDIESRLEAMTRNMGDRLGAVNTTLDSAMARANAYSGSLQEASGNLSAGMDGDALKALSSRLLKETQRMQEANRALEDRLEASRADMAAMQRDLAQMRRESQIDPLTKIANRKAFDERLAAELARARSRDVALCLIMFDIDMFKAFNDTHGHLTGDRVLRLVAQILHAHIAPDALAARFGGEEFVAILPGTGHDDAVAVAETVRRAIQAKELIKRSTQETLGRITLSGGVAQSRPDDTVSTMIERADHCLYDAKNAGRNRVVCERARAMPASA